MGSTSAIDKKVLRDAWRMRTELLAIAAVLSCGVAVFLGMRATMHSLDVARGDYYAVQRFADVFASCTRAPQHVADRLLAIPGVVDLQTRISAFVTMDVPGLTEAATGHLISIPNASRPRLNDIVLRAGRMPATTRVDEVVASEAFVEANDLALDSSISVILNGRLQSLRIVGVALSPEFVWSLPPGSLFPDDRRFGVLWMRRDGLAASFDMQGAFNDVVLRVDDTTHLEEILAQVDGVLDRYGGRGALPQSEQTSAFFVANELKQLRTFTWLIPILFLAVAAFLLNVVIGRLISSQREQIAALKALGYRNREIASHYAKFALVVVSTGCLIGILLGSWIAVSMTRLYCQYYRFPALPLAMEAQDVFVACGIAIAAAASGTTFAIRRAVQLPPAEAIRPAAPTRYRRTIIERLGLSAWLSPAARMVLRELERKPFRSIIAVTGIAMACSLTVLNSFTFDSMRHLLNLQFGLQDRADVTVSLVEPRDDGVLTQLAKLPGVLHVEPIRNVPVRLRAGPRTKRVGIVGLSRETSLQTLLGPRNERIVLPERGIVLSDKLAGFLAVQLGDIVAVEVLEGDRRHCEVEVVRIVDTYVGMTAHMNREALCRLLTETPSCNGAMLLVDDAQLEALHKRVKATPAIAGIASRNVMLRSMTEILDDNIGVYILISLSFSFVLAIGVLYNVVRITLSERARELASLRVLGFRRGEVAVILLGELFVLVIVALPLGLVAGRLLAGVLVASPGFDTDQFRLPLVVGPRSYGLATVTVLIAALIAAWSAWRKLNSINIIEVLKSRD